MLLNFNVFTKTLEDLDLKSVRIINTINPHSYCITKKDKAFNSALVTSDIVLPDGIGIVWAERLLNGNKIKKIAGYDVFIHLMQKADANGDKVFFLGASQETLNKIRARASTDFPKVCVNSYSPPYKQTFSEEDSAMMCKQVNAIKPSILFVGMTAPKQEKWVHVNKGNLEVKIICSIGAVFDFYAGNIKRSSPFWINLGLEWLPRLIREPKRLAERNFISTPKFILEVLSYKLFKKTIL